MKEEKPIKVMLLLFCGTYTVRVIFAIALYLNESWVHQFFVNDHALFMGSVMTLWFLWDSLPLTSMLYIHYKNFGSFTNEDYLYTEYSVDDTTSNYQMFDPSLEFENNQQLSTSGVINLDSSSDSSSDDDDIDSETEHSDSLLV